MADFALGIKSRSNSRSVIYDYERGLLFDQGKFVRELGPGYYNFWWTTKRKIYVYDLRKETILVASQEIANSEGIPVRISLAAEVYIEDVRKYHESSADAYQSFYVDLQIVMREIVASRTLDELFAEKQTLGPELSEVSASAAAKYGIRVGSVKVRDITVSGEIKKAYAEVLKARKQSEAMLERARGESAALRNLANAARLVNEQPALLQLRALQAISESPGSTLVFGTDGTVVPIRKRGDSPAEPSSGRDTE